jgi:hypothetical protein
MFQRGIGLAAGKRQAPVRDVTDKRGCADREDTAAPE